MAKFIRNKPIYESSMRSCDGKFVVAGVFQRADSANGNERNYPRRLWNHILNSPEIIEQLKNRQMLGELGHPDIVETTLTNVSHIVTKLVLRPNGEIYGEAEILDTPSGRILKTLYEAGVKIGISSRGYIPEGSECVREGDTLIIPMDYQLVGFDFVLNPSTYGAYPTVSESVKSTITKILSESSDKIDKGIIPTLEGLCKKRGPEMDVSLLEDASNNASVTLTFESKVAAEAALKKLEAEFEGSFNKAGTAGKQLDVVFTESQAAPLMAAKLSRYFKRTNLVPESVTFFDGEKENKLEESLFKKTVLASANKVVEAKEPVKESNVENLEEALYELRERYRLSEAIIKKLVSSGKLQNKVIENLRDIAVASKGGKEIRDRYLTAEGVISEMRDRLVNLNSEAGAFRDKLALSVEVANKLRDYAVALESIVEELSATQGVSEGVIKELRERYTLSEQVIGEMSAKIKGLEEGRHTLQTNEGTLSVADGVIETLVTKLKESNDAKAKEAFNESLDKAKFLDEAVIRYGISAREASRILENVGSEKAFAFVMQERKTFNKNFMELPQYGRKSITEEEHIHKSYSDEDMKMIDIIARTM